MLTTPALPGLTVVSHPLVQHKLAILRDQATPKKIFKELVDEIAMLMAYEATADLALEPVEVDTPLETTTGRKVAGKKLTLVPILRAGLGMLQPFHDIFPDVSVGYVGLERNHQTAVAHSYYCKLPPLQGKRVIVVDPMLATGGSAAQALTVVKAQGGTEVVFVCIVAAPEGVAAVHAAHPEMVIHAGALDRELNERKYILPGLGDFGDRLYGT